MTKLQMVVDISGPTKTVWSVLMDPSYLPKLYPNILTATSEPVGPNRVGTKLSLVGKAGKRKVKIFAETVELVPEKRLVSNNVPGGLFKSFRSVVLLEPRGTSTEVKVTFEYELNMSYLGRIFNMVILERLVHDNLRAYASNLKELSELVPLPE